MKIPPWAKYAFFLCLGTRSVWPVLKTYFIGPLSITTTWSSWLKGSQGTTKNHPEAEEVSVQNLDAILRNEGGISRVIKILSNGNPLAQANAADALGKLTAKGEQQIHNRVRDEGGIRPLIALVCEGSEEARAKAITCLSNLAISSENNEAIRKEGGVAPLVKVLSAGGPEVQALATIAMRNLAVTNETRDAIAKAGGIQPLITLIYNGSQHVQLSAMEALKNLAATSENRDAIRLGGGIARLLKLVYEGNQTHRVYAAVTLGQLAATDENKKMIKHAIQPLVEALNHDGAHDLEAQATAADYLRFMAVTSRLQDAIGEEGAIKPLIAIVRGSTEKLRGIAAGALTNLAASKKNQEVFRTEGGIQVFIELLQNRNSSQELRMRAASALRNLAAEADNQNMIREYGGIPPLIALMREGSVEARTQAIGTLRNLALLKKNVHVIQSEGAVPLLIHIRENARGELQEQAYFTLKNAEKATESTIRADGSLSQNKIEQAGRSREHEMKIAILIAWFAGGIGTLIAAMSIRTAGGLSMLRRSGFVQPLLAV